MFREDRVWVDQQLVVPFYGQIQLCFRTVQVAEEARAACHGFGRDVGFRGTDTRRIELRCQAVIARRKGLCLDIFQVGIVLPCFFPNVYLILKELVQFFFVQMVCPKRIELPAGGKLNRTQPVFVEVVGVDLLHVQRGIGVTLPAAA